MRKNRFLFTMLIFLILPFVSMGQEKEVSLNNGWTFCHADSNVWAPASVPGSVFTDLVSLKRIPNPLISDNESKVQWVSESAWCYQLLLPVVAADLNRYDKVEMLFEELDAYARIYLNGNLIYEAENMFLPHRFEVKKWLKAGKNELKVVFPPLLPLLRGKASKLPYKLPENDRVFARKAQFHFGWDWAPKIVNVGITKPVSIRYWNSSDFEPPTVVTSLNNGVGTVDCTLPVRMVKGKSSLFTVSVSDQVGQRKIFSRKFVVHSDSLLKFSFSIQNPKVWNPSQMGIPNTYSLKISVTEGGSVKKTFRKQIGFRNVHLVQTPDSIGKSFYFEVNGQPRFAKGANWTPMEVFKHENRAEKYRKLLIMAQDAGYNMLRVWGGGWYEEDVFYDLCDSLGIMVWQDAMFACAMYPSDEAYLNNVSKEIHYQSKRLSSHPSLVLWCGNNENYEGWFNWGWQKQLGYSVDDSTAIWNGNRRLFETVIPQALSETYGTTNYCYHPSSPSNGWGRDTAYKMGDVHYWGVWWGMEPFSIYRKKVGRFVSEYGFQGYPSLETLRYGAAQHIDSLSQPSVAAHQKHPRGYQTIDEYMQRDYPKPTNVEDYVYVSQLMQADGMGEAIKAHTQRTPYCMGSLFWQFSDCWSSISWAAVDYFGNPKPFYFASKRLFEPVRPTFVKHGDATEVWVSNIGANTFEGELVLLEFEESGARKVIDTFPLAVNSNQSALINSLTNSKIKPNSVLSALLITGESEVVAREVFFMDQPKNLKLKKPTISFEQLNGFDNTVNLIVSTDVPIKGLWMTIDGFDLSDNGFDLVPGINHMVVCKAKRPNLVLSVEAIKTISLNDVLNR